MVDSPRLPSSTAHDDVWSRRNIISTGHEICVIRSPGRQILGSVGLKIQVSLFGSAENHIAVELGAEDVITVEHIGVKVLQSRLRDGLPWGGTLYKYQHWTVVVKNGGLNSQILGCNFVCQRT